MTHCSSSTPFRLPIPTSTFSSRLLRWYRRHRRDLPWRRNPDPYRVWLSEIMLQQTRVQTTLPYFEKFVRTYPTLESLAEAQENELLSLWSGLGYYGRARNLHKAARMVCERYGGEFPRRYEDAIQLPGVGRYTAGAVLSIAYGKPLPVVDGNVLRVFARYLRIETELHGSEVRKLWNFLSELVEDSCVRSHISEFNQALMELGSELCRPRRPLCLACPLARECRARRAGVEGTLPRRRQRRTVQEINYLVAVVERRGRYLLRQNLERTFLKGFWEFPCVENHRGADLDDCFARVHGLKLRIKAIHPPVSHRITFRKLSFYPVQASLLGPLPAGNYAWATLSDGRFPLPSYVGKILKSLGV